MAEKLRLNVLTPDHSELSTDCDMVIVRSNTGEMGFLPGHAPLIAVLVPQVLRYKQDKEELKLFVAGGFVEVRDDVVSVLTPAAELPSEIDFERAERARERAQERLQKMENVDSVRAMAALARANARLSMRH